MEALTSNIAVQKERRELSQEELAMHGAATGGESAADPDKPNISNRTRFERGDVEANFAASDVVVERDYHTRWISQAYMEPQACTVDIDALGNLTVFASTQRTSRRRASARGIWSNGGSLISSACSRFQRSRATEWV